MILAVISFTACGKERAAEIADALSGYDVRLYYKMKTPAMGDAAGHRRNCLNTEFGKQTESAEPPQFVEGRIADWAGEQMREKHAILFIGATGIAVRAIAPHVVSKLTDSPVLVMDEMGHFVIPLLSGHVGGANVLAREIAAATGAIPVLTTATDLHDAFAVDLFAKERQLKIVNKDGIAAVSSKVLRGEPLTISVEDSVLGRLAVPEFFYPDTHSVKNENSIISVFTAETRTKTEGISYAEGRTLTEDFETSERRRKGGSASVLQPGRKQELPPETIFVPYPPDRPVDILVKDGCSGTKQASFAEPQERLAAPNSGTILQTPEEVRVEVAGGANLFENGKCGGIFLRTKPCVVGIGCRRGKDAAEIEAFVTKTLAEAGVAWEDVRAIASVDLKKDEPGICRLAERMRVPFLNFTAEELKAVQGEFAASPFVEKTVGVDNVCERAAICAGEHILGPREEGYPPEKAGQKAEEPMILEGSGTDIRAEEGSLQRAPQDKGIAGRIDLICPKRGENGVTCAVARIG